MEYVTILERLKSNYVVLKDKFLCKSRPYVDGRPDALDDLKSHYSSVINSPRTASYINNLEGLLRVLEKRNELSYDNIEPLIHIEAHYVESPELRTLLRNYEGNMRDAPVVPLFNVYDALSGKYNIENGNISINTTHNWFTSPNNNQRLYRTNHDEKKNQDTFNVEETRKNSATETASLENILFDETNILLRNNLSTFDDQRLNHGLSDSNTFNVRIQRRPSKHSTTVLVLILLAATMFITLLLTIFNARSSENSLESQPSTPNNVLSSGFVLQSPTTLPTLMPQSFHLTLSAPVQITAQRLPNHEEPQVARIGKRYFFSIFFHIFCSLISRFHFVVK